MINDYARFTFTLACYSETFDLKTGPVMDFSPRDVATLTGLGGF